MDGVARVAGVLLILTAIGGCDREAGEPGEPLQRADGSIVGGAVSSREAVIPIVGAGFCTAVLLAPNLVMTAKHCVVPIGQGGYDCSIDGLVPAPSAPLGAGQFGAGVPAEEILVGFSGESPFAPRVAEVLVAPGDDICASDLALLILETGFDDPTIAPVRLATPPALQEGLTAVGFGVVTGNSATFTRHERPVTVLALGPFSGSEELDSVQAGFFAVGEGLCRGDSGSPAIAASGAAVGVASTLSNPGLDAPDGTANDCMGETVRGKYQATVAHADLIREGFARAGATPWEEGQPDPRAELAQRGEPCAGDAECASNACVEGPDGETACSQGCLESECPEGYGCETVDDRQRCVPDAEPVAEPEDEGCSAAGGSGRRGDGSDRGDLALLAGLGALGLWRRARKPRG